MSIEAFLAVFATAGIICLIIGVDRALRLDRTALDKRLRRYGGKAYQLTDDEQKQAASAAVTQLLAKRVEASISGRTFAAALQTDLARANLKLTVGEFLIIQVAAAALIGMLVRRAGHKLRIRGGVSWKDPAYSEIIRRDDDLGVQHLALQLEQTDPDKVVAAAERLQREVLSEV